jgi:hypothetical protein
MTRSSTAFASFAVFAALAAAPLSARATEAGNVVGGGSATIPGGGDDMRITYSAGGAGGGGGVLAQSGRLARFAGTDGDGLQVEYSAPVPPAVPGAGTGREAWLVGGGDDARVVYASPHRRR